jgi:putative tryptophan/tyrosine transport system substrate-binding protein
MRQIFDQILKRVLGGVCALAIATATLQTRDLAAAPAMIAIGSWFKIGAEVTRDWTIIQPGKDPNILQIRPKRLLSSRPLRRILVLYPRTSSAYDTAMTKIINVFEDKRVDAEITINLFGVDTPRGRAALENAESNHFDLVIGMGSEATAWLWDNYRGGRLPVVSVCSKDPVLLGQTKNYTSGSGNNFAFTSLNMPIDAQMSYILQLRPNLKNFAVLVDSNNLSAVQTQAKPAADFARERGIRVFDLAVKNTANIKDELARHVRDTVAVMRKNDPDLSNSLFWITGSTTVFNEIATINANSYRVPVLSAVTDVVRAGDDTAALSVGISFESNAYQAGLYAVGILDGSRAPGDYPVGIVSPPDVAISFRKAREIGLRIPFPLFEGATVIYDNDGTLARSGSDFTPVKRKDNGASSAADTKPVPSMTFDTPPTFE